MEKLALLARLEAKPGKEKQVEALLKSAQEIVEEERGTAVWYAFRLGPTTFGIFDTFNDEQGRQAHATGKVVDALNANADLFAKPPQIEKLDILANKPASSSNKAA